METTLELNEDDVKKKIAEIRENIRTKRQKLRREQAENGFVQVVKGGLTYRLGNELEDFDRILGFPPKP